MNFRRKINISSLFIIIECQYYASFIENSNYALRVFLYLQLRNSNKFNFYGGY